MEFSSWLSAQRHDIAMLHVMPGEYATRYHRPKHGYTAAERRTSTSEPVATVTRAGGRVLIQITVSGAECLFVPSWEKRDGLSVSRAQPRSLGRELSEESRGRALAALRAAAGRVFEQHRDEALELDTPAEQHTRLVTLAAARPEPTNTDLEEQLVQSLLTTPPRAA